MWMQAEPYNTGYLRPTNTYAEGIGVGNSLDSSEDITSW